MILKDFYWYFDNPFREGFIEEITKEGLKSQRTTGLVGTSANIKNARSDKSVRKSKVSWLKSPLLYNNINPLIHTANRSSGWNFQWDWNETAQFTEYKKGDFYSWHMDTSDTPYGSKLGINFQGKLRKLSSILLLSDPGKDFKGGELEMDFSNGGGKGKKIIKKLNKKGSFIVFPSFVRHRIKPVTKGIRHSLVLWHIGFPWC